MLSGRGISTPLMSKLSARGYIDNDDIYIEKNIIGEGVYRPPSCRSYRGGGISTLLMSELSVRGYIYRQNYIIIYHRTKLHHHHHIYTSKKVFIYHHISLPTNKAAIASGRPSSRNFCKKDLCFSGNQPAVLFNVWS